MRFILTLMVMLGISSVALADLSPSDMSSLTQYKYGVITLQENANEGIITKAQSDAGIERYIELAKEIDPQYSSVVSLMTWEDPNIKVVERELTMAQKAVGFLSFMNFLYVLASVVFVVCAGILFKDVFIVFFMGLFSLPIQFYEAIAYVASVSLIALAYFVFPEHSQALGFVGVLGIGGSMILSAYIHNIEPSYIRFFSIMMAVTIPIAILLQSPWIGFLSSVAFVGLVGFSPLITPGAIILGFRDDHVGPATAASFYLLVTVIGLTFAGIPQLEYFETGAIWLGSFVGYLGLLIASSKWFSEYRVHYIPMQVVTIGVCIGGVAVGSILSFPILMKMAGTFFVLWILEKFLEIPAESVVGWAVVGLIASSVVGLIYFITMSYPQLTNYLFLV